MKNQPEHISKMQEKVEEIRLAQEEVNLALQKAPDLWGAYMDIGSSIDNLMSGSKKYKDPVLESLVKQMDAVDKKIYNHLNKKYEE